MIKMKFKGRTFNNARSLANAITRDLNQKIERNVRQAAATSGVRVRKTHTGIKIEGDAEHMERFHKRLKR